MARDIKRILNSRIHLSEVIDENRFEAQFANGYLLGELLFKFGLQPDFPFFTNNDESDSKIRNFSRVLPALADIGLVPSVPDVHKIMQAHTGTSVLLVYHLLKALKVLPMRDPRWTLKKAVMFHRKGSWADFISMMNVDYETYKALDEKYHIPGEDHCRHFELLLRNAQSSEEPADLTLEHGTHKADRGQKHHVSVWETIVRTELDIFDSKGGKAEPLSNITSPLTAEALDVNPRTAPSALPIIPSQTTHLSTSLKKSARLLEDAANPSGSSMNTGISPQPPDISSSRVGFPGLPDPNEFGRPENITFVTTSSTKLPPFSPENLASVPESSHLKPATSSNFDKEAYLQAIHTQAEERKKRKMEVAKHQQNLWLDLLIEHRRVQEQQTDVVLVRHINEQIRSDRKIALDHLIQRRNTFDAKVRDVHLRANENALRQVEYVRSMVNQGFWELLGKDALNLENLQKWCAKAQVPCNADMYDTFCKNYQNATKLMLHYYDQNFIRVFGKVCKDQGDSAFSALFEPEISVNSSSVGDELVSENSEPEEDASAGDLLLAGSQVLHVSDTPVLFWDDVEFEEYKNVTTRFRYEDLEWMAAFVSESATHRRNLGHIISCVINDAEWKPLPPQEPRFPAKFISIWVSGKRTSQLKKAILTKLAMTYNLEVISVADLIQDAVEAAMSIQPEITESRDKSGAKRRTSKAPVKKASLPKIATRGKMRSVAPSTSGLLGLGAWGSPASRKDEFGRKILKSLMEDVTLDSSIIVDLIEQAIESRVVDPPSKTVEPMHDAVSLATSSTNPKKGARSESKAKMAEQPAGSHADDLPPFGWILTDLPQTTDVLNALEHRLGGSLSNSVPNHWESSPLVPDTYGPKPRQCPRSFFGAVIDVDCPGEIEFLHPEKHTGGETISSKDAHTEDEKSLLESPHGHTSKTKSRHNVSPQPPHGASEDGEVSEIFTSAEIKRHLSKFFASLDQYDNANWRSVESFYLSFSMMFLGRICKWADPEESYSLITAAVEEVMKENRKVWCHGVTPEVHEQLGKTLSKICRYVWDHRSAIRNEIAQRMVGFQTASSVVHYLFKQDVVLVRDVYYKCQARLYDIARRGAEKALKTIGIALYRKSVFPFRKCSKKPRSGGEDELSVDITQQNRLQEYVKHYKLRKFVYTKPVKRSAAKHFPAGKIELELLRFKRERLGVVNNSEDRLSDRMLMQDCVREILPNFAADVYQWHRKNYLVLSIQDLNPSAADPLVYQFPYLGTDTNPEITRTWQAIESQHQNDIKRIIPLFETADRRLDFNTKHVKSIFMEFLNQPNPVVSGMMSRYAAEYNRLHETYPDIHPVESWKKKLSTLYLQLSTTLDYRFANSRDFLRNLMGNCGYSEIVCEFRNTCLHIIQAEANHFKEIVNFLWMCFKAITHVPAEAQLDLPNLTLLSYAVSKDPLQPAKDSLSTCSIDSPVELNLSMVSGTPEQEQMTFLRVLSDDEALWRNILQSIRLYGDSCAQVFLKKIRRSEKVCTGAEKNKSGSSLTQSANESEGKDENSDSNAVLEKQLWLYPKMNRARLKEKMAAHFQSETEKVLPETSWYENFAKLDLEELLATVRRDVLNRRKLKEEAAAQLGNHAEDFKVLDIPGAYPPEDGWDEENEAKASRELGIRRTMKKIMSESIDQEVNCCMLKICRFIVMTIRKCNAVRKIASETFYVLDCWLEDSHKREQQMVDEFLEAAVEVLLPDGQATLHDAKRWKHLG